MATSMFSMKLTIVLSMMLALSLCADKNNTENSKVLQVGTEINVTLQAEKKTTITLKIDRAVNASQSLFITAQSPYNDPFQEPTIYVTSDKNFQLQCQEEASDFMGICQIEAADLTQGRVFSIQLYCEVDCELKVAAYISSVYQVNLGESNWLKNYQNTALVLGFEVEIPKDQNFTEFLLIAQPSSTEDILEGTSMFVNYGDKPKLPTNSDYQIKSSSVSQHRIGVFLSNTQLRPGDKVSFLVVIAPHVQLTLTTNVINIDTYNLYIGSPVFDFTTADEKRIYILDLDSYETPNQVFDETILLKFISYSGYPTITVSLDSQFSETKILQKWEGDTAHSFEITAERRKQIGKDKKIYIKVESFWSTNFQLEASVNRKPFIDVQPQITELFHVQPQKMKNLIFSDENYAADLQKDGIVQYKMSVQVSKDSIGFRVRNCGAFKEGKVLDCVIEKDDDLKGEDVKKSFSEIQLAQSSSSNTHILIFKYNVSEKCQASGDTNATKKYTCKFHILITNDNPQSENMSVQFTINKDTIKQWLREGHMEKGTVMQGSWNYYAFQLPSIENLVRLEFYATVIQGDVTLLLSQKKAYPSFDDTSDAESDIEYSVWNSVILNKEDIKAGFYYIGVYGNSMTDYSIGVAIERMKKKNESNTDIIDHDDKDKNNSSNNDSNNNNKNQDSSDIVDITEIRLEKGVVQTINMPMGKATAKFVFTPMKDKESTTVKLIQIQGHVDYTVTDKFDDKQICDSKVFAKTGDDSCDFQSTYGHDYLLTVKAGEKQQVQVFTILYSSQQICNSYPWNFPLQVVLNPNEKACLSYKMYKLEDIHIALSLSPIQLLSLKLVMEVKFAQKTLKITKHEKIITKKELNLLCQSKDDDSCTFTITLSYPSTNKDDQSTSFLVAVENYRSQNVLFESIASRMTTQQISVTKANHYFYYVFEDNRYKDLSIILTSETASKFQIAAKVLSNSKFAQDTDGSLYPNFNQQNGTTTVNSTQNSPISVLSINADEFIKAPGENEMSVVLISVFGIPAAANQKTTYVYSIEVNQGTDTLLLGDSRISMISKDQVYEYEVDLFNSESSTVEVRSFSDDGCINAFVYNPFKSDEPEQFNEIMAFTGEYGIRVIMLKTNVDYCSYQISFNSLDLPIQNAVPSVPYDAVSQESSISYYSYYHTGGNSFIVLQMITAGSSYLYVQSIKSKQSIQNALNKSLQTFTYSSDLNGDLQISNKSKGFCSKCYYLIAFQGNPSANAEMTINPYDVPILLKEQAPLRDRLQLNETNHYQFYAKSDFVVSISVLYGRVDVTVKDYTGKQVASGKQIYDADDVQVEADKGVIASSKSYFDERTKYSIEVKTAEDSSYYINIKKRKQGVVKVYEGLPISLELEKDVRIEIDFYSIHKKGFLNLLVEDLKYYQLQSGNELTFEAKKDQEDVLNNVGKSESNYNVQLKAIEGRYTISIVSKMNTQVSLVFARKQFNHLQAARTYFMDKPSIFEIYSPGDSIIIEIYSCRDDVEVRASSNFSLLMDSTDNENGIVRMEHANYGGHYVIVADNLKGEYYLETSPLSDDQTELSYLITYHLFNPAKGDKMPYRSYVINNPQINYKYYTGGVEFQLSRVRRKEANALAANVTYKLYISNSSADIEKITKCSLGKVYTETKTVQIGSPGSLSFEFQLEKIKEIIGKSQTYLVGGEATVELVDEDSTHIKQINFVYEVSQLTINAQIQLRSESKVDQIENIWIWIVFPFLVGSILLFFAARFLYRSYSNYPTQLVEEDDPVPASQSEQAISQSKEPVH